MIRPRLKVQQESEGRDGRKSTKRENFTRETSSQKWAIRARLKKTDMVEQTSNDRKAVEGIRRDTEGKDNTESGKNGSEEQTDGGS
ncbi:hypothetical protein JTB14_036144 [Gonioctena quinquepunctata]|nr:hypothetical protein JTB14_036144 [Gonioctena quinquepunctata]